jgi:hypothetical protein
MAGTAAINKIKSAIVNPSFVWFGANNGQAAAQLNCP